MNCSMYLNKLRNTNNTYDTDPKSIIQFKFTKLKTVVCAYCYAKRPNIVRMKTIRLQEATRKRTKEIENNKGNVYTIYMKQKKSNREDENKNLLFQ